MPHFLVEITYTAPLERIAEVVGAHREHLQIGYDRGMLLCSGPQVPRTGGILIARAETKEALLEFCAIDPYRVEGVAEYRVIEFEPVKSQPFLKDWIDGRG
jgi:uncharacterized protein YciI